MNRKSFLCAAFVIFLAIITRGQEKSKVQESPVNVPYTVSSENTISGGSIVTLTDTTTASAMEIDDPRGEMLVKITLTDGKVAYGKKYTPDAAANAFWQAIARRYPCPRPSEKKP